MAGLTIARANEIVDDIVDKLKNNFQSEYRFNVSEVVKGGSLGHGTAVPEKFDLDLVLYSRDIRPREVIRNGVDDTLRKLDEFLRSTYRREYQKDNITPYTLQFTLWKKVEVDLLPSPYWSSASQYFAFLEDLSDRDRRRLQCSEAKWEKYFFQQQPNAVKEYTKRAKSWRNMCWPTERSSTGRPKSFLLSLLVAEGYRRVGRNDPVAITKEIKSMVRNHRTMCIHWAGDGAHYDERYLRRHGLLQAPCIIDPANPFNNVYISGVAPYRGREDNYGPGDGNWTNMIGYIHHLDLSKVY